jgi:hypothetical protein
MFVDGYAIPELLDTVLENLHFRNGLGNRDIKSCCLVNKQFNARATRLLYRDVSFSYPCFDQSKVKLFNTLHECPRYAAHIRRLHIRIGLGDITGHNKSSSSSTPFEDNIAHVLRNATGLEFLNLNFKDFLRSHVHEARSSICVNHDKDCRAGTNFIAALAGLMSRPKSSIEVRHMQDRAGGIDMLLQISARYLNVFSLSVWDFGPPGNLANLAQFRQLKLLSLRKGHGTLYIDETTDLAAIFDGTPLATLYLPTGAFKSLPTSLQFLMIEEITLCEISWKAICDLEHLTTLSVRYTQLQPWLGRPMRFKSTNLQTLAVDSIINRDGGAHSEFITEHVLQPIFNHCPLTSITLSGCSTTLDLSQSLVKTLFAPGESLLSINTHSFTRRSYTFDDLTDGARYAPHLKKARLNWPDQSRLTFGQCQKLARLFPQLDVILFQVEGNYVDPEEILQGIVQRWVDAHKGLQYLGAPDLSALDWDAIVQAYKMSKFIHDSSPCLGLCTSYQQIDDYLDLYVSLKQVRRHLDHT